MDQEGLFDPNPLSFAPEPGSDRFWVVDASLSYRLPRRYGLVSVEVKNLFDEQFQFQSMARGGPDVFPERVILVKMTLSF